MRKSQKSLVRQLLRFFLASPKSFSRILILAVVLGGGWYGYEVSVARPAMAFMGVPKEVGAADWRNHVLRNQAYMVGYSEKYLNPLWVTYKITQKTQSFGKRPGFSADWRSPWGATPTDYTGSGFDRGHHAPNYVIASRHGTAAQHETFLMTNISPQKPSLNQKTWQRLESVSANFFSVKYPEFWVVTGPIFDADPNKIATLKNTRIAIPKAFYKIFIRASDPTENLDGRTPYQTLAMILPQNARTTAKLTQFVTTVADVEAQTGLDFFWELPDDIEKALETSKNYPAWSLEEVSSQKNRY